MAAYVIAEVDVHDATLYDEYRRLVPETVARHGGRYLVRGGAVEAKEGGWSPKRLVVIQFPSAEAACTWYHSAEYAPLRELRRRAAHTKLVIAEGA